MNDPRTPGLLPAAHLLPSPARPRRVASMLGMTVFIALLFAAAAPWRQNIRATGSIIALSPDERPQTVDAPISGRIARWHVVEGEHVEEGQLLVEIVDNDPNRLERIEAQREGARARVEAYANQITAHEERVAAYEASREARIRSARESRASARESLRSRQERVAAATARHETSIAQDERVESLSNRGFATRRDQELATLAAESARAALESARADERSAQASVRRAEAELTRARASADADLRSARASLASARQNHAKAEMDLVELDTRVVRQGMGRIVAPRAGTVQRILVRQFAAQVSSGEALARFVPDSGERAAALYVDGNDAALISPGRHVRIQFEGWPAIQFAGWPSVAVGTFGGVVQFVDPSDDGSGDFRVVITELREDDDYPWPNPRHLRQGTRAKGWILLGEVSVGFEIWRQLNGFPPAFQQPPSEGGY